MGERRERPRGARLGALAFVGLTLSACRGAEVTVLDLAAVEGAAFLVFDRPGRPLRIDGPLVVEAGRLRSGRLPALQLETSADRLLLVTFDLARLAREVPGFYPAEAPQLRLGGPTDEPTGEVRVTEWRPARALASVSTIEPGSSALVPRGWEDLPELSLGVPRDPEHCRPSWSWLSAFDGASGRIPMRAGSPRIQSAGRGKALLVWRDLHLLERGRPFTAGPGTWVEASTLGPPGVEDARVVAARVDPSRSGEPQRVWTAVSGRRFDGGAAAWLVELRLEQGGLTRVSSSTIALVGEGVDDLDVDGEGRVMLSHRGRVWLRAPDGVVSVSDLSLADGGGRSNRIGATGLASRPIVASTDGRVHIYLASTQRWIPIDLERPSNIRAFVWSFAFLRGPTEWWASGSRASLFRTFDGEDWSLLRPELPPRFEACGIREASGRLGTDRTFSGLGGDQRHLFVVARDCAALLAVRRTDLCTSLLGRDDGPPEAQPEALGFADLAMGEGELWVVSGDGEVLVSDRRED